MKDEDIQVLEEISDLELLDDLEETSVFDKKESKDLL